MPMYILYPTTPAGLSSTFTARELTGDDAARRLADALLVEHPRCAYVAIWQDLRQVEPRRRPAQSFQAA